MENNNEGPNNEGPNNEGPNNEGPKTEEKGNKGEKAETACKRMLFTRRADTEYLMTVFGQDACDGIELVDSATRQPYTDAESIKKAKSTSKADVSILLKHTNVVRHCSIKALVGAKPAILNHTPRSATAFQTELADCLPSLDLLASEYIAKRTRGEQGEDVAFSKLDVSADDTIKQNFMTALSYFVFRGTGSKRSPEECDAILIVEKDASLRFIDCDTDAKKQAYIETVVDKCVLSFRSKGMPTKIPTSCAPWIYVKDDTKFCGSLHIRL
jgi:hypothetical protein